MRNVGVAPSDEVPRRAYQAAPPTTPTTTNHPPTRIPSPEPRVLTDGAEGVGAAIPAIAGSLAGRSRWGGTLSEYYKHEHLTGFGGVSSASPELGKKFFDWYNAVFAEGALTEREKCLIALAVAHTVQCPYCIEAYTDASLEKGADLEQMTEALHVAVAIRGGASLVHGMQMREAAKRKGM